MKYDGIIATFGEAFLKGRNRHRFTNSILHAVKRRLAGLDRLTFVKGPANIDIELHDTDPTLVIEQLDFVFGIQSYRFYSACASEIEAIKSATLEVARELEGCGRSIKVVAKRSDKGFRPSSPEVANIVGRYVAEHSAVAVDLENPDLKITLHIQRGRTRIVSRVIPGQGGLPIGVNGTSLLMLSGGLDSPVAGYLMMKRGLAVDGLHFDSPPYTSPRARQKVFDLAEKLAHYLPSGKFAVHIVPFTDLQRAIFEQVPESYGMTVMRRMMYRVTARVAERIGCALLANGESLGQVASQTPMSMLSINCVTTMPVIRPVACMDKTEIIDIARRIGTHDISIRPYEDCCTIFVPKSPATAPRPEKCDEYESRFEWEHLINACVEGVETVEIEAGKPIRIDSDTSDEITELL
ncbi:MAG: tRNA 4-thiouridine(8) synthase ThiI [bacterium]|nr:tRNA 4-thiouridine(8) synthase ThiI [bacterium]